MTAIGLALFFGSMIVFWFDEYVDVPEWVQKTAGVTGVLGFATFIFGLFVWIWRVMP